MLMKKLLFYVVMNIAMFLLTLLTGGQTPCEVCKRVAFSI